MIMPAGAVHWRQVGFHQMGDNLAIGGAGNAQQIRATLGHRVKCSNQIISWRQNRNNIGPISSDAVITEEVESLAGKHLHKASVDREAIAPHCSAHQTRVVEHDVLSGGGCARSKGANHQRRLDAKEVVSPLEREGICGNVGENKISIAVRSSNGIPSIDNAAIAEGHRNVRYGSHAITGERCSGEGTELRRRQRIKRAGSIRWNSKVLDGGNFVAAEAAQGFRRQLHQARCRSRDACLREVLHGKVHENDGLARLYSQVVPAV